MSIRICFQEQDAVNQYPGTEPFLSEAWKDFQTNREPVSSSERKKPDSSSQGFSVKPGTVNQIGNEPELKSEKLT